MKIHILGICGVMTTPIAIHLKNLGYQVTGSDQDLIYPPYSDILKNNQIFINQDIDYSQIDLFIVGSSFKKFNRTQKEFDLISKQNYQYISATEYLAKNVIRSNSILVAGSYGKTTTAALVVHILKQSQFNPSFFYGGQTVDEHNSLLINDSSWSVVEADESINGLDTQAKFLYYPVKYLLLTSADWEHRESYPSEEDNQQAFTKLIKNIGPNGFVVYNPTSDSATILAKKFPDISFPAKISYQHQSLLIGQHNQVNISLAKSLCLKLGIENQIIDHAIATFPGIKRRLQLIKKKPIIFDDFAQSPPRVLQAVNALHQSYPHHKIIAFFEPHSSFLDDPKIIPEFQQSFSNASQVILGKIHRNPALTTHVTFQDYQQALGDKVKYFPLYDSLTGYLHKILTNDTILLHLSSGGNEGIQLINQL